LLFPEHGRERKVEEKTREIGDSGKEEIEMKGDIDTRLAMGIVLVALLSILFGLG
jgi:hypothetical protein